MKYQLAKLYRGGRFFGYGIAVGGFLLDDQVSTTIDTDAKNLTIVTTVFHLSNEHSENQPRIDLDNPLASNELNVVIHTDKPFTVEQLKEFRETVIGFLTKHNLSGGGAWTFL